MNVATRKATAPKGHKAKKLHSSPSGQMGDRLQARSRGVWRNFAPASTSSRPLCLGDLPYDNPAHFPPLEEPRHASKRRQQSKSSSGTGEQPPLARTLLPHWVRMKDRIWQDSVTSNSKSSSKPPVPHQEAATATATERALDENEFETAPKPVTTQTARVLARKGPFGASSARSERAPLDARCMNLVFESFGMIGISTQADDPQVTVKRSPKFRLTSEQKQRLHDAIEEEANGRVLDALERVIQEIRDEIDEMSHHMMSEMSAGSEESSEPPSGIFDHSMWTGCTSTPNNKPANGCSSPKIRSFANNNFKDTYDHSWTTRPHTIRTKSHGAWNAKESDSDAPKASSNAGGARSVGGYPGVSDRYILDFRQPPFPRPSRH
ncbi:uncharacterized protein LOC117193492 isoform X2 [Drosophila miranda]|uniref:uncharacterized protein LOC117193492 isoform X1 n=1 Tax=Drosophila miranda TaxID=7229 RepID=UPI00143F15C7|nr:uncharacterized protein LOC117193492 isoform X1 [Drosophila miranda]XP_033254142.1 uncharacterized protein LOC117193492 isoform X2 [Drosophila miranda]